jgi:hypothetical protein
MFRALFAHHQEALHIQQLVYVVRIMSAASYTPTLVAAIRHNIAQNIPIVAYAVPPEDGQVVVETCRGC